MATPALNPLVEKIRAKYPGEYDDMDDATLTKKVLAKYPEYSDLAAPPMSEAPGGPKSQPMQEGSVPAGVTSFATQLSQLPSNALRSMIRPFTPSGAREISEDEVQSEKLPGLQPLGHALGKINPVVMADRGTRNEEAGGIDWGATAANILPAILGGVKGLAEAPEGTLSAPIRYGARGVESVINNKFRPLARIMTPADEALASKIRVPGRDFGLPKPAPVYPGAHLPDNPGTFPGAPYPEHPGVFPGAPNPTATPEQLNPSLISKSRTMPGQIAPEIISPRPIPGVNARPFVERIMPDRGLLLKGNVELSPRDAILQRMQPFAENIVRKGHGPEPVEEPETSPQTYVNEDLSPAVKRSLRKVKAAKQGSD